MSFESQRGLVTFDSRGREEGIARAGMPFRPRAVLLWWAEREAVLTPGSNRGGIGIHVDGGGAVAHAWFADDRVATEAVAHAVGDFAVFSLASPLASAPACHAEMALHDDGFALHWHAARDGAWDVHYLAFGGSDLREAGIASLALVHDRPRIVADVGFRPDFALFVPTAAGGTDDPSPGLSYGIGVAASPHCQGATGVAARVVDGTAFVRSAQRGDSVVALPGVEGSAPFRALARLVELGPDWAHTRRCHGSPGLARTRCLPRDGRWALLRCYARRPRSSRTGSDQASRIPARRSARVQLGPWPVRRHQGGSAPVLGRSGQQWLRLP